VSSVSNLLPSLVIVTDRLRVNEGKKRDDRPAFDLGASDVLDNSVCGPSSGVPVPLDVPLGAEDLSLLRKKFLILLGRWFSPRDAFDVCVPEEMVRFSEDGLEEKVWDFMKDAIV